MPSLREFFKKQESTSSTTHTFGVANVEPASKPLAEVSCEEAIRTNFHIAYKHPIQLVSHSESSPRLVRDVSFHPFMAAVAYSYAEHRPLCLSPDMIWLLVTQGVSRHINLNAEKYRSRLVAHEGKKEITIIEPGKELGNWQHAIEQLTLSVQSQMTEEAQNLFLTSFSTTGLAETAVSRIVLLEAVKEYFDYKIDYIICGIPNITLEGTAADWERLAARCDAFCKFDLEWWIHPLKRILREFTKAASGKVNSSFWRSIYREYTGVPCKTPSRSLGWIFAFFPYLNRGDESIRNPFLSSEALKQLMSPPEPKKDQHEDRTAGISISALPTGLSSAPFKLELHFPDGTLLSRSSLDFVGGFVGVSQSAHTFSLRPEIGWAVRKTDD